MIVDHVPSVTAQGVDVRFIASPFRAYNGSLFTHGKQRLLITRRFNPATQRCDITLNKLRGSESVFVRAIDLPLPKGTEHLEDPRVIEHDGRVFIAYTEGRYTATEFIAVQRLARLKPDLTFDRLHDIHFRNNFVPKRSEKNWQFFSHDGALHFVYSIESHIVCRLGPDCETVVEQYSSKAGIQWPYGTLSGGTPPVRVGDRYVSFCHSYVTHPERRRRYSMQAYEFEAAAPFRVTRITRPILRGSANDPALRNENVPQWRPLVVFPCSAELNGGVWTINAGVNDSYDAIVTVPEDEVPFEPVEHFSGATPFYFMTKNYRNPIRLSGTRRVDWLPVGPDVGGSRLGIYQTSSPHAIALLEGRPGITPISEDEFLSLQNHE